MRTEYRVWHKASENQAYKQYSQHPTREFAAAATTVPDLNDWNVGGDPENRWVNTDADRWLISIVRVPESQDDRVELAIDTAREYGGYDGDHHKKWVIDQMLRHLAGDRYEQLVPSYWKTGVAP
jgi:hypothetical protein